MLSITANELKTKGVSILDNETVITVRGKRKFVVIDFDYYQYLRECELSRAIEDTLANTTDLLETRLFILNFTLRLGSIYWKLEI